LQNFQDKVSFIWSVADLLRGDYKQSEYGRVILPLTVLRRLDCVLEKTKPAVLAKAKELPKKADDAMREELLNRAAGQKFHNLSKFTFESLKGDPDQIAANLRNYVAGFSKTIRDVFLERFEIDNQIDRLDKADILYLVVKKFCDIDLHPDTVSNLQMGYIFEELIRKFSEQSNETAGEHFTPREVIRLMVNLLFGEDRDALTKKGVIRTLYDPACGTGGMLTVGEEYLRELNPGGMLKTFGQELNPETFAVAISDTLIKGHDASQIVYGNSFTEDGFPGTKFDYMLANPPFGVEWKKYADPIVAEHETLGMSGRFGPGLPRISDGSLLFLMHMVSKMKPLDPKEPEKGGSRLAIVFNGSPLFSGAAGSGESEVRRWIIENDWLEAIIGMPDQLFYNTGISTYIWIVTNRKAPERRGKVQLVDASSLFVKMRRSLGNKRNEIGDGKNGKPDQIAEITRLYGDFIDAAKSSKHVKVFNNEDFGYWRITVERPLRLNFCASEDRIERVKAATPFTNLAKSKKKGKEGLREIEEGQQLQEAIITALAGLGTVIEKKREPFVAKLKAAFKAKDIKVPAALLANIVACLGERDETADICRDSDGNPEPDADLRDYENVPLTDDIDDYFKREVLPHVPDAWIDRDKTKKGYEIPFTRHFYEFTPLRPLDVIEKEIADLEAEIQASLGGVVR
jgi:type I restriction enzyme M protein